MNNLYQQAGDLVKKSGKILVISHRKPDCDTLGSAIALKIYLSGAGKEVVLACVDKPSRDFTFLPHLNEFVNEFEAKSFDLIIIVDAGASYMTNFHLKYPDLFTCGVPILNIDHHATNDNFGVINIVEPEAASATVMIYKIFKEWGVDITEDIATCLLAGVYSDTGSFMHSNTSAEVYEVAGELLKAGARVYEINKALFKNNSIKTLKLWGKVLENTFVTEENVVMAVVKDEDFKSVGAGPENLSGVVDYLNMVPGAKFAVLVNEDRQGNVKGSFRTRGEADLSRIAGVFGGGGHPKASGFSMPGKLIKETRYTIVSEDMSKRTLEF